MFRFLWPFNGAGDLNAFAGPFPTSGTTDRWTIIPLPGTDVFTLTGTGAGLNVWTSFTTKE